MNSVEIGKFLSELRKQKGLKQKEVAEAIQVSDKAVSRWETGRGVPDVESLQNLSDFYETTINEILAGKHFKETEIKEETDKNVKELVKKSTVLKKHIVSLVCGMVVLLLSIIYLIALITYDPVEEHMMSLEFTEENVDNIYSKLRILEDEGLEYTIEIDTDKERIKIFFDTDTKEYKEWIEKLEGLN